MKKAGALLAKRAYSRKALQKKLAGLAEDEQIESVLNRLERLNLLNDAQYAYNFARRKMEAQGWSPAKVLNALLGHQVESSIVQSALNQVLSELDDQSVVALYLKKRYANGNLPNDLSGIRKLISHLRHRGFDEKSIFDALRGTIPNADLQQFETGD